MIQRFAGLLLLLPFVAGCCCCSGGVPIEDGEGFLDEIEIEGLGDEEVTDDGTVDDGTVDDGTIDPSDPTEPESTILDGEGFGEPDEPAAP